MRRYEAEQKAQDEYGNLRLKYEVKDVPYYAEINQERYQKMVEALDAVGVWFSVEDGILSLSIYPEDYIRTKERNAGRRKTAAFAKVEGTYAIYKYSDIVFMMQTMTDQQIADKIDMKIATYYRHKKSMKESSYYKALDLNRLRDKEYLETVAGNYGF